MYNPHLLFFSHVSDIFNAFPQVIFHVCHFFTAVLSEMMDKFFPLFMHQRDKQLRGVGLII